MQLEYSQEQQPKQQTQPLGFFATLSQTIFGSSNNSSNASQSSQAQSQSAQHQLSQLQRGSSADVMRGKALISIWLDVTGFKMEKKLLVQEEITAGEIIKQLKAQYSNQQSNMGSAGVSGSKALNLSAQMSNSSTGLDKHSYHNQLSTGGVSTSSIDYRSGKPGQAKPGAKSDSYKDEFGLFLVNTKAKNPLLMVRKLAPHDLVLRIWFKSLEAFKRDGEERFKICFVKQGDIEQLIKSKGGMSNMSSFDEENHVVSQLGKSIINNKTYERKGKLQKKSLNSDKFKERQFVLDKEQLFYFKNEKQKDKNFNLIMLTNATIQIVHHPKQKYCFEIENDNRKYLLSTKSEYDLNQWFFAIQDQIRLSRDNKNIANVNASIVQLEKELASNDMSLIQKIFKPKNAIFNPVQPLLLDFINEPFINELLPNLTKYVTLVREPDYQRHALDKAKDIVQQLKSLQKKVQNSKQGGLRHSVTHTQDDLSSPSTLMQLTKVQSQQVSATTNDDYKRYKELKPEQKIEQIFSDEDASQIEQEYERLLKDDQDSTKKLVMNPRLFNNILLKINRIIKYNYLEDFYREKKIELLSLPTQNFKMNMTPTQFNCIAQNAIAKGSKNVNIFEAMLMLKLPQNNNGSSTGSHRRLQSQQSSGLDPSFQNQMKEFIGSIAQDERGATIAGISKVQNL